MPETVAVALTHCALCREPAELRESHILPAFVFRWLKDTSVTGYLRLGENPRKRVQDGIKVPLLCAACEERFSRWETAFATDIFHPYNAGSSLVARYDTWMLKFCVSVSWRVAKLFTDKTGLKYWSDQQRAQALKAMERWRAFIFDEVPHPGIYEQHILPLDAIKDTTVPDLPDNINRYLMRGVDIDAPAGEVSAFIYAKMGRFALFGMVQPTQRRWRGSLVRVGRGVIKPSEFVLPYEILDYLMDRARRTRALQEAIPDHQMDKIQAAALKDAERTVASDEFAAMLTDKRMFGEAAILRKPKSTS